MRDVPADWAQRWSICEAWRITRADQSVRAFTDHDEDLVIAGEIYRASSLTSGGPDLSGAVNADGSSESDLAAGLWDGAAVEVWRVDWRDPMHRVLMSRATIGAVRREGAQFSADLLPLSAALDLSIGRVFARSCDAALGDARCGVDLSLPAYRATGLAEAVAGAEMIVFGIAGLVDHGAGSLAGGLLLWPSGARQAIVSHVRTPDGADRLVLAGEALGVVGETVIVTVGCDKALATCRDRFQNTVNFRGFPYMPGVEFALYGPGEEPRDGGSRWR